MWRTPSGERALAQSEGELVRELVGYVYDQIDVICVGADLPYAAGVELFDRLELPQQLALLHTVGTALLSPRVPPPELTAVREATVMVLFHELRCCLELEIDSGWSPGEYGCDWRRLLRQVYLEDGGPQDDLPDVTSTDLSKWVCLVDAVADRILWDADWDMEELFIDESPERASYLKQLMRIPEEYYRDVAPDPSGAELDEIRHRLNELTGATR